jgi:hypothetical protein
MHKHKACVIVAFVRLHSYQHKCVHTAHEDVNQEKNKVLLIVVAYTIIDPRTVMVHPSDASLTRRAMVALRHLNSFTLLANSREDRLQMPKLILSYVIFIFQNRAQLFYRGIKYFGFLLLYYLHNIMYLIGSVIIALDLLEYGFVNIKVVYSSVKLDLARLVNQVWVLAIFHCALKQPVNAPLH